MIYREKHWRHLLGNLFLFLLALTTISISLVSTNALVNYKDIYNLGYPYGLLTYVIFWWLATIGLIILYLYGRTKKQLMVVAIEIDEKIIILTLRNGSRVVLTNVSKLIHSSYRGNDGLHIYDLDEKKYEIPLIFYDNHKQLIADIEAATGKKFEFVSGLAVINVR